MTGTCVQCGKTVRAIIKSSFKVVVCRHWAPDGSLCPSSEGAVDIDDN